MIVYKAHRKGEGRDGKIYWAQVGLSVLVGEYEGKPSVTLVDERTGEKYPCFPPKAREAGPREAPPMNPSDAPF